MECYGKTESQKVLITPRFAFLLDFTHSRNFHNNSILMVKVFHERHHIKSMDIRYFTVKMVINCLDVICTISAGGSRTFPIFTQRCRTFVSWTSLLPGTLKYIYKVKIKIKKEKRLIITKQKFATMAGHKLSLQTSI